MNYDASCVEDRSRARDKVAAKNVQNVLHVPLSFFFLFIFLLLFFSLSLSSSSSPHASCIGTSEAST